MVKLSDTYGKSVFCAMMFFAAATAAAQTTQLLPGPVLYQPELRSIVNTPSVALQWYYYEGANLFRVQASHSNTFSELFLDATTAYHYYVLTGLPRDGTRIFWRVRACYMAPREGDPRYEEMECISDWSPSYSFFSGKPDRLDDNDNRADKPGIIVYFSDCIGLKSSEEKMMPWADLLLLFLAVTLAGQLRIPCGKQ